MKNNGYRWLLRIWIALISIVTFLGGWIFLGHSNVIAATTSQANNPPAELAPLPTLTPLQFSSPSNTFQPLPQQQQSFQSFFPRIRTRGS
jgi:hypothetical protein